MNDIRQSLELSTILPDPHGGFGPCPGGMTEEELIRFLRIPEISNAANHSHVIENLKRVHRLPRIHLCGKAVLSDGSFSFVCAWAPACGGEN